MQVMNSSEKRKHKRLPIALDLSCRKVSSEPERLHTGRTVDVSPAGLYFQTPTGTFKPGNLLKVELSIPPTTGLLEFGGKISGLGKVLRTCSVSDSHTDTDSDSDKYGVALEFCQAPKLFT